MQSDAFYVVLLLSIVSVIIDLVSSTAMNMASNWWVFQITMTVYVVSMPLLAATWVGYAYVLIHKDDPLGETLKKMTVIMLPYAAYSLLALTNPFTGLFFTLSESIEYKRGVLFMPVGVGFIMLYSFIGLILILFNRKKIVPSYNAGLITAFFAATAVLTWIQLANPGWLIINASYAVIYIWCDITVEEQCRTELYKELTKKNEELKITAEKAEQAAQAKTEFLSRMSHDIRTPMNAIIGLTHLAKSEDDLQTVRGYFHKIDSSSKFLLGLINDILDMSKIENGEMTLNEAPFSYGEFKESIQTVIMPLIEEKNINFVFEMGGEQDYLMVDKLRFCQIFFNLLSNAAKFTPNGGTISVKSELGKGSKIKLYIRPAALPEKEQETKQNDDILKGIHILLVEDNELNTYVAKTILEQYSCIVDTAENGMAAITKFERSEENFYDVILMDVHMPVMDGIEATKRIRALERSV